MAEPGHYAKNKVKLTLYRERKLKGDGWEIEEAAVADGTFNGKPFVCKEVYPDPVKLVKLAVLTKGFTRGEKISIMRYVEGYITMEALRKQGIDV